MSTQSKMIKMQGGVFGTVADSTSLSALLELILLVHDGIDGWIDLFGPSNRSFQHLLGADLALGSQPGEGDGVVLAIFFEPHGLQISKLEPMEDDYSYSDHATGFYDLGDAGIDGPHA